MASEEFQYIQPLSVEKNQNIVHLPKPKFESVPQEQTVVDVTENNITQNRQDSDNDGIIDENDECPDTSSDFIVSTSGCPKTATLNIKFPSKKYNITNEILHDLEDFASFLKENKNYQVIIYGYTDSIGDKKKNRTLSQKRANSIKKGLITLGVSSTKLTAIGKGEQNPIADNMNREGREKNRRIEIELID